MRCIITAGPTYESLDRVRRLTNFSTGRLGIELAAFLTDAGHRASLLIGEQATWSGERRAESIEVFTTTQDLRERLMNHVKEKVSAIFHAAAVSDFKFGKVWSHAPDGSLAEARSEKFSTQDGGLLAELVPTPKIIAELRDWFPEALLVGWKYEVDGNRETAIAAATAQLAACRTDACVGNGPAYGKGFGFVSEADRCQHLADQPTLFRMLEEFMRRSPAAAGRQR